MSTRHLLKGGLLAAVLMFGVMGCFDDGDDNATEPSSSYNTPKYVFYFIGDGMGSPQINGAEAALNVTDFKDKMAKAAATQIGSFNMSGFPVAGMATTHADDRYITGSAAAATALACGYKTAIGVISKTSDKSKSYKTMAELAKTKGMKVGIVSSVSIDHATPACFYAHTDSRNNYQDIGQDLIASGFDYFAGGSVRHNKYSGYTLDDFKSDAAAAGYTYAEGKTAINALSASSGKVICTLPKFQTYTSDGCALPYAIDHPAQTAENQYTLAQFTQKGIDLLDNDNGFFLMVEGGKIDWACHANDAVSAIYDQIAFDDALGKAIDFYNNHKDETLIIVTGDHECGGMTLGWGGTGYESSFDILNYQSVSYQTFSEMVSGWVGASLSYANALDSVKVYFGLGNTTLNADLALSAADSAALQAAWTFSSNPPSSRSDEEYLLYGPYYDAFTITATHILNNKAGMSWTSYQHTGVPVPVMAMGEGQSEFSGYYDNTDVAQKIVTIADLGTLGSF